jgi:hypothetical protein
MDIHFFGISTTRVCRSLSNLNFVYFMWDCFERLSFAKYAILLFLLVRTHHNLLPSFPFSGITGPGPTVGLKSAVVDRVSKIITSDHSILATVRATVSVISADDSLRLFSTPHPTSFSDSSWTSNVSN